MSLVELHGLDHGLNCIVAIPRDEHCIGIEHVRNIAWVGPWMNCAGAMFEMSMALNAWINVA